ncbi:hypothetical protein OSB04_003950 [Centaurea solstitialis]|uniref:DUF4283 domain-containing protein n=1 Tax=Centaurea solstitialis TaxID=347529 RepID=A0AA38TXM9_9ASTR|nr:hypothetical protein OSB04_003950 [Centaurea solstitialis]
MVADQPPDPPVTRNRARQIKANKGTVSSSLPTSPPATTAAVPACGGAHDDRPAMGSTLVSSVSQTNTIAAALIAGSFLAAAARCVPVACCGAAGLTADDHSLPCGVVAPLVAGAGGISVQQQPAAAAAPSGGLASRASPATAGLSSPVTTTTTTVARPSVSPTGTTGVIGDDVGAQGLQQQSSMLSPADALFSSFLASPIEMGYGCGVLPTATNSETVTLSSPGRSLKPRTDKFNEVGSNTDNEHNLSDGKTPNAGSFVDSRGKVHLHADETDVAHKPVSFADPLKKSANLMCGKGKLTYYPPVVTELGTRRAIIPDELVQKQASEWALTLAGYFIGKRSAFPFVQYHARRMWKKYGLTDVILNDQGYFFFKFNTDQGLNFVFENGPWLFNGMPIFILRWLPGLCFDKPDLKTVPLWVNIYGLPLDVWDYEIISLIASVVGEPVSVDRYTDEMCETKSSRANFARVLVNVSADYELPSDIDAIILGKLRKFKTEFLWKPKRCSHCKVFGHDFERCVIRPRTTYEVKKVNPDVGESSKPKDDGFNFPKRKKKLKPTVDPLKVGPKVAGIKINQRYVPKVILPTTDPLDKGKAKLNDDNPSPKALIFKTERIPMPVKVSNQFSILEEDSQWILDKKEIDDFVGKRGVGLELVIINSWSRTKLDYFTGRWERVFGKEPDGTLRGFTLPDRQTVSDDDGSDSDSEDDAEFVEDAPSDATMETPYGTWLRQKQDIDRRLAERDWPTATQMATWSEKQNHNFQSQYLPIIYGGSLQYLAFTRPDISFAINKLSQFMHAPRQAHWQSLKRVLRYLKGTIHHGLFLNRHSPLTLSVFSDSDWGGVNDVGRSTTAYLLYLGNNIVSWKSTRQKSVSRSSTEAEYKALANATAEILWLKNLLSELGIATSATPTFFCDNTGATYLCANPVYHSRMKHVALDYHFVREQVAAGTLRVLHVHSQDQLADMLTKPLSRIRFGIVGFGNGNDVISSGSQNTEPNSIDSGSHFLEPLATGYPSQLVLGAHYDETHNPSSMVIHTRMISFPHGNDRNIPGSALPLQV